MIEIKNLNKSFGEVKAINSLSLTLPEGSVLGLVGSNGAGKSTLLRILSGVYSADSGEALIDGENPFNNTRLKQKIIFISDYPYFSSSDTLKKLSSLYRSLYPEWNEEKYTYLKELFQFKENEKIVKMSKGMQRQAAIILGLSAMPKYILFDEIFDGLDPVIRELVKRILIEFAAENKAGIIIASHNLRELEDVCDSVCLIHSGGLLAQEDIDSLKLGLTRVQFVLDNPEKFEKIKDKLNIVKITQTGKMFELTTRGEREKTEEIISSLNPAFSEVLPLTLEEVFISEMEAAGYDIGNIITKA